MAKAEKTRRSSARWPQVTLRELLLLMTFFAVLYGIDVMRGERDFLARSPILMAVFVLWRIVQHCRGVEHVFAQVFVDAALGAAIGTMATVLGIFLLSFSLSSILTPLLLAACFGAIAANTVGLVLGRYRRTPETQKRP